MNVIDIINNDMTNKLSLRRKREVSEKDLGTNKTVTMINSEWSGIDAEIEYIGPDSQSIRNDTYEIIHDETERGKRQVQYFLENGYNSPRKNWPVAKQNNANVVQQIRYNPNVQNIRYQPVYTDLYNTNYFKDEQRPTSFDNNFNVFLYYAADNQQLVKQFRPSQSDPNYLTSPRYTATRVVTKSPPISSLNNQNNPFYSLAGGFYNNSHKNRPNNQVSFSDSSLLPSTIVTGKPLGMPTSTVSNNLYKSNPSQIKNSEKGKLTQNPTSRPHYADYDNEDSLEYEESSSEEEVDGDTKYKNYFPKPPYEFTHPNNKYANIENPFASSNFDFDVFLSKVSNGQYTPKPKTLNEVSTPSNVGITLDGSKLNYKGMSTLKPFTGPTRFVSTLRPNDSNGRQQAVIKQSQLYSQLNQPQPNQLSYHHQQQAVNQNGEIKLSQQTAAVPLEAIRPKIQPPNFKDDRELPLTYSFSTANPKYNEPKYRVESQQAYSVTQKPYVIVTGTGAPIILSTPKYQHMVNPEKIVSLQPYLVATGKPYINSSFKPSTHEVYKQSSQKPLTTVANQQLSALQNYWENPSTVNTITQSPIARPTTTIDYTKLSSLFAQAVRSSTQIPIENHNIFNNQLKNLLTTTKPPAKRRPIPKPSPEMNDYYYDDEDDQYYYEPVVKPKYMPNTEIRPQRPPMAQNYKEYEDNYEDFEDQKTINATPSQLTSHTEIKYNSYKPIADNKKYNNISFVTKNSLKDLKKNTSGKILVPVLVEYASARPSVLIRPDISNYEIVYHNLQNQTLKYKKPSSVESSPYTTKPPKYLNQTTLRPYTVRHRLAKPTMVAVKNSASQSDDTKNRVKTRHQNIVAQMKFKTPKDNYNQETRYSKTKHDDKTNR